MFKEFEIVTGWEEPLQLLCSKCTLSWDKLWPRENVSSVVNSDLDSMPGSLVQDMGSLVTSVLFPPFPR